MKKILIGLAFFFCFTRVFAQSNDTTKYIYYPFTYGNALDRYYAKHVLMIPNDTIYSKDGLVLKGGTLYKGNGIKWTAVVSGGSSITDSLTPNFIPYWDALGYLKNSPLSTSAGLIAIRGNTVLDFGGVGPHGSSYASFADTSGTQIYNIGEINAITGAGNPDDFLFFQGLTTGKTIFSNDGGVTHNFIISNGSIRPFVGTAATRTASPSGGDMYWDTDTACLVAFNGTTSAWHSLCGAGGSGSDSGFSVQKSSLSGVPIQKAVVGAARFVLWDTSAATNPGAIITPPRLKQKLDSIGLLADSIPVNNLLSVNAGTVQLGGTSVKGNTSLGFHDTDTLSLDSLKYLKMPHLQLLTASDQTYIVVRDTISGIFYNIPASRSDTTGVAAIKVAGGIPFAYYDSATNKIKFQALPTGPWVKVGNITSTQAATDTVRVGNPAYWNGKFVVDGSAQINGPILGRSNVNYSADTTQTDTLYLSPTGNSVYRYTQKVVWSNGGAPGLALTASPWLKDVSNANVATNSNFYFNQNSYREQAANGGNQRAVFGMANTYSINAGDSLFALHDLYIGMSNPTGFLRNRYALNIVGSGFYPNVGNVYGMVLTNFSTSGVVEGIHSNLAYCPTCAVINSTGGAHSILNWTALDTAKLMRIQAAASGDGIAGYGADSTIKKWLIGTGFSITGGNTLNAASGGSATQGIDSVLRVGNTTSKAIHSSDSIAMQLGLVRTALKIGDSLSAVGRKVMWIEGTSIEAGYLLPDPTLSWVLLYADIRGDSANIASTLVGGKLVPTMTGQINTIPIYDSTIYSYLIFEYGLNDTTTRAFFKSEYMRVIDSAIGTYHKWPQNRVVIVSAPYGGGSHRIDSIYSNAAIEAGIAKGVRTVDLYNYTLTHNYLATLNPADSIHPNLRGATKIVNCVLNSLRDTIGGFETNQLVVNHLATFRSQNIFKGPSYFNGRAYFNDSIGNLLKLTSGLYVAGDANITEKRWIAYNGGATNLFGVGVGNGGSGPYFLDLYGGQAGGGASLGTMTSGVYTGTAFANSTGLGIFNRAPSVALDVTGGFKASLASTFSSGLTIVGDNNIAITKWNVYSSALEHFSMGVSNSTGTYRTIIASPSDQGGVDLGTISSSDGSTYSSIMSASNVSGTKRVGIVQTTPVHTLDVTGDIRSTDSVEIDKVRDGNAATDSIAVLHQISAGKFSINKIAPGSGTGKANNDSVSSTGYASNGHLYKVRDSMNAVNGAPAWGSYTSTFTNTTNVSSSSFNSGGYTKVGNCVHVFVSGIISTTAGSNTATTLTVSIPGSYSPAASSVYCGNGVINITGGQNVSGIVATGGGSTVTFTFASPSVLSSTAFQLSFDYFY